MAKSLQLKHAIWTYVLLNWTVVAYAAENALVEGIEAIPPKAIGYVVGLAVVGGAAGTLTKLARPDSVVRSLALEITKDLTASIVAGLLAYFFTNWKEGVGFWAQAGLVTVAGYGGSKVLDMALGEGLLPWLRAIMARVTGVTPKDGSPPA